MKKNALYIQSGGPTSVINASAYGVIQECIANSDKINTLYAARYGQIGILNNQFVDVLKQDKKQIERLKQTPSMIFRSCRYRIPDENVDDSDYKKILKNLKQHNIGYIFYNGGNGSVRACKDLKAYLDKHNYECKLVVIPKTVDNDISYIDHAPGFPSAARHVAISVSELAHDVQTYDTALITVVEVMGRNTGFLAAAAKVAETLGRGADLIYVPELVFDEKKFINDVASTIEEKGKCIAVVAEGVKNTTGQYLFENNTINGYQDPYLNMGGITPYLTRLLRQHFSCKIRGIDLNLMQRCSAHTVSPVDISEAEQLGRSAVKAVINGESGKMISINRLSNKPLIFNETLESLEKVAMKDNTLPLEYINRNGNGIEQSYLDYILPLLGDLPEYAQLNLEII